ncbi:MAG: hypothetical protein KJP04_11670, partial [Arenicella sp.]|nr:hypothetical protein [Arenicella sp.]
MEREPQYSRRIEQVAEIARSAQRSIIYLLLTGLAASAYIIWNLYSPNAPTWWNIVISAVVLFPALIWSLVWVVLQQLQSAPRLVTQLALQPDGVLNNLDEFSVKKQGGLRGVFNTLKAFREQEG